MVCCPSVLLVALAVAQALRGGRSRISLQYIRNLALLFVWTSPRFWHFGFLLQFALVFAFRSITHARSSSGRDDSGAQGLERRRHGEPGTNP
jgi:hypothetical protein